MALLLRSGASGIETRRQEAGLAVTSTAGARGSRREEEIGLAWGGGWNGSTLGSSHATADAVVCQRRVGIAVSIFIEGRGRRGEGKLVVSHVLCQSGSFDGSMKLPHDNTSPYQYSSAESAEYSADCDEKGALGDIVGPHEGCVVSRGNSGWWITILTRGGRESRDGPRARC